MRHYILRILVYYWTVIPSLGIIHYKEPDYCNETIYGANHVMCLSKHMQFCDRQVIVEKLGKTTKLFILHAHNNIRQTATFGKRQRGVKQRQDTAANMNLLVWSEELEQFAHQWASQCRNSTSLRYDQNRNTSYYYVNQLVAIYTNTRVGREFEQAHPDLLWLFTIEVAWVREAAYISSEIIDSFREPEGPEYRNYTQMIWAKTEAVGCGYTRMQYESEVLDTLVCNYGPGGNIEGQSVYIRGPVLSACDSDTYFSVYYRGLCQKFYYRTTPFVVPAVISLTALILYISFFLFYLFLIYYLWLSQRYGQMKKLTTGTGKLLKINEKDYVLADY